MPGKSTGWLYRMVVAVVKCKNITEDDATLYVYSLYCTLNGYTQLKISFTALPECAGND